MKTLFFGEGGVLTLYIHIYIHSAVMENIDIMTALQRCKTNLSGIDGFFKCPFYDKINICID